MGQYITHQGRVESINEKHIKVRITQTSACASCEAKKLCNSSESKEKLIDIYADKANNYKHIKQGKDEKTSEFSPLCGAF